MKPVKVQDLVDVFDCRTQETQYYLNIKTGGIVAVEDEYMRIVWDEEEDNYYREFQEWEKECIRQAGLIVENEDDFVSLPEEFEINEYQIMEQFCFSVEDERLSAKLCDLIQGRGAFRRFKDAIYRYGVADQWYEFKEKELRKIARDWCKENEIPYEDV